MRGIICLLLTTCVFTQLLFSQVSIKGPQCVITGTVYQYLITGKYDSASNLKVCITGGKLDDSVNTCIKGMLSQVKVIWNQGVTSGKVSLTSSAGNSTINVMITSELNGGSVNTNIKEQFTGLDSIPVKIKCSPASGGGCSPEYVYQWQQSDDRATWKDIADETEQDLKFTTVLEVPMYYRRKVTDKTSGIIKYSDVASVFVTIKPPKTKE